MPASKPSVPAIQTTTGRARSGTAPPAANPRKSEERWIQEHLEWVRAPWMIGVGAAFDYHSSNVPWAPPAAQRIGAEWVFRLLREPRLRSSRYWRSLIFVLEATGTG